jgi:maleamate amidohydrolase
MESENSRLKGSEIVADISPQKHDFIILKKKPSVFFGTPLMSYLNKLDIDTVLVTGGTTSGCVRATVIDAFSYNFFVGVIEDCTFDRGEVTHAINLFDMDMKYADVMALHEVLAYLKRIK